MPFTFLPFEFCQWTQFLLLTSNLFYIPGNVAFKVDRGTRNNEIIHDEQPILAFSCFGTQNVHVLFLLMPTITAVTLTLTIR